MGLAKITIRCLELFSGKKKARFVSLRRAVEKLQYSERHVLRGIAELVDIGRIIRHERLRDGTTGMFMETRYEFVRNSKKVHHMTTGCQGKNPPPKNPPSPFPTQVISKERYIAASDLKLCPNRLLVNINEFFGVTQRDLVLWEKHHGVEKTLGAFQLAKKNYLDRGVAARKGWAPLIQRLLLIPNLLLNGRMKANRRTAQRITAVVLKIHIKGNFVLGEIDGERWECAFDMDPEAFKGILHKKLCSLGSEEYLHLLYEDEIPIADKGKSREDLLREFQAQS